jgi:hypothetical protein
VGACLCEFVQLLFREMAMLEGKGMGTVENVDKFNHSVFCPVGVSEDLIKKVMATSRLWGARDCATCQYEGGRGGEREIETHARARTRTYIRCGWQKPEAMGLKC